MKKSFSYILAFLLLFSITSSVRAEESGELKWEDYCSIAEDAFEESAHFISFEEVETKIWIPDYMLSSPLTEEDLSSGALAFFIPEDESSLIYISYTNMEGYTLDAFQKHLTNSGIVAENIIINGIPALYYYSVEDDMLVATYETAKGYFFQLMFYPFSDDFFSLLSTIVLSSVQPELQDQETHEATVPINPISRQITK